MTTMIEPARTDVALVLEKVVIKGDLASLTPAERVNYYNEVCRTLSLNPFTRPFEYIVLNNKLTLYARKDATDQLRKLHGISITKLDTAETSGVYIVTAYGRDKDGRIDSAQGAVYTKNLSGEALANALMKAETKAKRRLTLSMCGLGWTDESEVDSIPEARTVSVDMETGEVLETKRERQLPPSDMVMDESDRYWQRYLVVAGQAEDREIPFEALTLPVGRAMIVAEGLKLTRLIEEHDTA